MTKLHSIGDNPGERYAKERQDYVYGGDDNGKVLPMTRYGEKLELRLTPSGNLNDLMSEFLSPEAHAKLQHNNQTLKLMSKLGIYIAANNTPLQHQRHEYEQALRSDPVLPGHQFHLRREIATRDDVDNKRFSIAFKVGIEAIFYSVVFAEPFFTQEQIQTHPNYLVFGHVFDYDELADPLTVDHTVDRVKEEFSKLDSHSVYQLAPHYYRAHGFSVGQRTT